MPNDMSSPDWVPTGHPGCVDLSHNNQHPAFDTEEFYASLYEEDVRLVILKATQGTGWVDPKYASRRKLVVDAGLKVDAYHFYDNSPVDQQIAHFLSVAELDSKMRGGLDCETEPRGRTIQPIPADNGAQIADQKLGKKVLRYSGAGYIAPHRVPLMKHFLDGPFWLAKYGPAPKAAFLKNIGVLPQNLVLWQETGSGKIGGESPVDLSFFHGTIEELEDWPNLKQFPDE